MDGVVGADGGVRPAQVRLRRNYVLGPRPVRNKERVAGNRAGPCYLAGMSQGGEGDPTKSDDEADIDTIELLLRPEEFARLESVWEAQTQAALSHPVPEPSRTPHEPAAPEQPSAPFDVTRARAEYPKSSDEPATGRTDSTVELPPLRLTPDGQPMVATSGASGAESGRPPAQTARTHFHYSAPAPRDDFPKPAPVAVQPAPAVSASSAGLTQAPAEPPRPPLSVEQFGGLVARAGKPIAIQSLVKAAPITVGPLAKKAPAAVKAVPRQQTRWPWLALSSVAAALVIIIVWLFSVDTSSHVKAPAATPAAPIAPVEPVKAAPVAVSVPVPVRVPVSAPANEPRQQHPAAAPADTVKFSNPFDQREVFEFPAGTTRAEARDAVAEILIRRARDRQSTVAERTRRRANRPSQSSGGAGELAENATRITN